MKLRRDMEVWKQFWYVRIDEEGTSIENLSAQAPSDLEELFTNYESISYERKKDSRPVDC